MEKIHFSAFKFVFVSPAIKQTSFSKIITAAYACDDMHAVSQLLHHQIDMVTCCRSCNQCALKGSGR